MGRRAPTKGQNGKSAAQKRVSNRNRDESPRASSSSSIVLCDDEDGYVPSKKRALASGSNNYNHIYGESPREDSYLEPRRTGRERSSINYAALNSPPPQEPDEELPADSSGASYGKNYNEAVLDSSPYDNGYSYSNYKSSATKTKPGPATVKLTSTAYASKHNGPQAEEIIGSRMIKNELHLLVKWKDSEEADMIPAKVARYKYPAVVIPFYEQKYIQQLKDKDAHPGVRGRKSFP